MTDDAFIENVCVPLQADAVQDMPEYVHLSGQRASDLREVGNVDFDMLFATYRDGQTYGQTYGDISSAVKTDSIGLMHIGSMAYMDTWQYSPVSHNHVGQYTYMSAEAMYGPSQGKPVATLSVGRKGVENPRTADITTFTVYCPIVIPHVKEPAYGTLRFMYAASVDVNADYIASDEFDGWIYPDGKQYTINPDQFNPDKNPFVTNEGTNPFITGNKLTAPNLDRFIKANPFVSAAASGGLKKCEFKNVEHYTALASHSHAITNLSLDLTMGIDASKSSFIVGKDYNFHDNRCTHWGRKYSDSTTQWKTVPASIIIAGNTGITIGLENSEGLNNPETVPCHDKIAVMIYVGGRRKEYEKVYLT